MWYWDYDEQEYPITDVVSLLSFFVNCMIGKQRVCLIWLPMWQIKFRVTNVSYPQIPVEQPKESKPFAPMLVSVSILLLTSPLFASYFHYLGSCIFVDTLNQER